MNRARQLLSEGRHPLGPRLHPEAAPVDDRDGPGRRCGNCGFRERTDAGPKCRWPGVQRRWHGFDALAWWPGCRDHRWDGEEGAVGVRIEDVSLGERIRRSLGDLDDLVDSILAVGLLRPIVITRTGGLIAGRRRLEAYKRLGWEAIPAVVAEDMDAAVDRLTVERDESTCRKEMSASELFGLGTAIQRMPRPRGAKRTRGDGQLDDPGRRHAKYDSRKKAAKAVGMSPAMYSRVKQIYDAAYAQGPFDGTRERARAAMRLIDRVTGGEDVRDDQGHKVSVTRAYEEWRRGRIADDGGERTDASPSAADVSTGRPRPRSRGRTDVVATVGTLLARTEDAAALAERITRGHLTGRREEAAVWGRRLSTALEPVQRLLDTLQEVSE